MLKGTLKIHTENILPIIKKWLYSEKDIFVRELISNSCDAQHKLQVLQDQGEAQKETEELKIQLLIDKENKTLQFIDCGLGMSAEEVEKYIAQVAFSGAEEFVSKYKTAEEKDQIIGHFGLGFYSAYMVAAKVTIDTLSYRQGSEAVLWECDGSASYSIDKGSRTTPGTTITLYLNQDSDEFLEEAHMRQILKQYCAFLPFPIYLNETKINEKEPLWLKAPTECTDEEYLEFYRSLYPMDPDPIFWIHLNVDYPFHLKGILYFPKMNRRFDMEKTHIKLFCNRVFVSENCKDLIPEYLMSLKGTIDSPDIPLNVSRSTLQMDKTVRQLSTHISKKVADRLSTLYHNEREKFLKFWPDIEVIIKLGVLQDEKFYSKAKDFLIWKNLKNEWTTIEEYTAKQPEKVFYTVDEHAQTLQLYKDKEVIIASSPIDTALMSFLEEKLSSRFQRIDGAIDDSILDKDKEDTAVDADGKTKAAYLSEFFKENLPGDLVEVEAKSLSSNEIPGFIVLDENMRRMRDYMALSGQKMPLFPSKKTFIVNTNSKLINGVYALKDSNAPLAKEVIQYLYDLSLLAQKELDPTELPAFIARSSRVLEGLVQIEPEKK